MHITYSSIKHETKCYNYFATKEAVAEDRLETCYQTKKTKCNVQQCYACSFFVLFFQCSKQSDPQTMIRLRIWPSIQKVWGPLV